MAIIRKFNTNNYKQKTTINHQLGPKVVCQWNIQELYKKKKKNRKLYVIVHM